MNILNITDNYLSENPRDLAGVFLHRQFLALKQLGCEIRVINPQPMISSLMFSHDYPFMSLRDEIKIYRPRFFYIPKIIKPGINYDLYYSQAVQRALRKTCYDWKPDIILCDWITPCGFAGVNVSKLFRVPLVLRARGGDVRFINNNLPDLSDYFRSISAQADLIITNGQGLLDDLQGSGIFNEEKLHNLTNGIDGSIFHPPSNKERLAARSALKIPDDALVWVFVGTWDIHKGTRELAYVIPKLLDRFPRTYFLSLGPIQDKESYNKIKSQSNRATFLGMVNSQTVVQSLNASDIFILPSHAEGLPNSLLEAMACGLPSIVTAVGGVPDIINHEINGLLIPPKDELALEVAITRISIDKKCRERIGNNACQTIFDRNLDLSSVSNKLYEIILRLINNGH